MEYDAVTIGNHEFDYGADQYADYLKAAGYPAAHELTAILGTNTRPPHDHPLYEMEIRNYIIKELDNGLRVGIFGLIGEDAISKTAQPGPVQFDNPIESARQAVDQLQAEGVDILISVNHSGVAEDIELAKAIPDIDIIVGGHSHTALHEPIIEGKTVIVQAGHYMQFLGVLELEWDADVREISIRNVDNGTPFLQPIDSSTVIDEQVQAEVERYEEILNHWIDDITGGTVTDIRQNVARSENPILRNEPQRESAIGNFITDAMKNSAEQTLGQRVDLAVQANGAIRADITPGSEEWSEGIINFYDLVMPFGLGSGDDGLPGYPLVSFYMTEDEVRNALEVSILMSELMGDNYFLQFSGLQTMYDPNRAVIFHVPFTGTPVPSTRAVLRADLELPGGETRPLQKGSDTLLHVVTDYYIAGFLPMVGDVLPNLKITLRDENGNPVDLDDTVVMDGDHQLKVWQAVLNYAHSLERGADGLPVIPETYHEPEGRQAVTYTLPLWVGRWQPCC
jgi:5'-nucleotidase / UDP-sugar diphosphatase